MIKSCIRISLLLSLVACQHTPSEMSARQLTPAGVRVVQKGDTLYSIAREAKLKPELLARMNKLDLPYTIYPGQRLLVGHAIRMKAVTGVMHPSQNTLQTVTQALPVKPLKVIPVQAAVPKTTIKWQWPVRGKILQQFFDQQGLNKGIDIAGRLNEPVSAAAPGLVVYRGNALKAYGNLVILKHKEDFLSAYAHNAQVKVKEGEEVKAGQVIATMGATGTEQVKLHFEIRYKGKPLDPLLFLPK